MCVGIVDLGIYEFGGWYDICFDGFVEGFFCGLYGGKCLWVFVFCELVDGVGFVWIKVFVN